MTCRWSEEEWWLGSLLPSDCRNTRWNPLQVELVGKCTPAVVECISLAVHRGWSTITVRLLTFDVVSFFSGHDTFAFIAVVYSSLFSRVCQICPRTLHWTHNFLLALLLH